MTLSAAPLVALAADLGIDADALAAEEGVERLSGTFTAPSARVAALTAAALDALLTAYGDSITLTIGTGDLPELTVRDGAYAPEEHGALVADAKQTRASFRVTLRVDKARLLGGRGWAGSATARLFFFSDVLERLLARGPVEIERELWPDPSRRLVVAVLDSALRISGACLSVLGTEGSQSRDALLEALSEEASRPVPGRLERIADRRLEYVGWDSAVSTRLTPLHFRRPAPGDAGQIGARMDLLTVGLGAMYLCDRARRVEPRDRRAFVQVEFRGGGHVAFVPVDWAGSLAGVTGDHTAALADVVAWCYDPIPGHRSGDMLSDRLPFVQTRIAQLLEGRAESERLLGLALTMPAVDEGVRWAWRSFIEGRVNEYLEQVRELEAAVAVTVERFSEQVAGLVKRLSDALLAAVAAFIGSSIAAAFRDPFDAGVFRWGMLAYAAYVVVFPLGVGLTSAVGEVRLADKSFAVQRDNLAGVLGKDRVDRIVGERPDEAKRRFFFWAVIIGAAYVLAAAGAVVAAFAVPPLIAPPAP